MKHDATILIVDDEMEIRNSLAEILSEDGFQTKSAGSEAEAQEQLRSGADLAIIDIMLGSGNGMNVLRHISENYAHVPAIMITGHGTVSLAAEAFRLGAHDFLEKPLRLVQVRTCVRNALEKISLRKSLAKQALYTRETPVYVSLLMKDLYATAAKLAPIKAPVVVLGPSGSGKELIARYLHFESPRAQGPFVATNAASMPVTLAEDELFGHEKGAFTGAHAQRAGQIEEADEGTLFLDEIADMDLQVQAKLLRVIETGCLTRLGSTKSIPVSVRFVCATHKNIEELIKGGKFREDLWYRLSAFVVQVPPLRKRPEDIPGLAIHFLKTTCAELGIQKDFSPDALVSLQQHPFPGNVRELKHAVSRLAVLCDSDTIGQADVESMFESAQSLGKTRTTGSFLTDPANVGNFNEALTDFEKTFLRNALATCNGNITLTAQKIGMAQSNLSRKLKDLGLR